MDSNDEQIHNTNLQVRPGHEFISQRFTISRNTFRTRNTSNRQKNNEVAKKSRLKKFISEAAKEVFYFSKIKELESENKRIKMWGEMEEYFDVYGLETSRRDEAPCRWSF